MPEQFLLDTNAYFNFMKNTAFINGERDSVSYHEELKRIKEAECYISAISRMEIISVIGKYARGMPAQKVKCDCLITEDGKKCDHYRYTVGRKPMKQRLTANWIRLIEETLNGSSPILSVAVLPLSEKVLVEAQRIVRYALVHNFGSLDAVIAATLSDIRGMEGFENMQMITSDKGLKACLDKCQLPYLDAFKKNDSFLTILGDKIEKTDNRYF